MTQYHLELNSIGCRECRPAYLETLRAWLDANLDRLDDATREKAATSPLRVFDNYAAKPEVVRAALDEAPRIGESLCAECIERFAVVRRDLDAAGVGYRLEPTLVRGLDYYSRTTWEFIGPLENENATLSGGGRYDYLVEEIGGPPTPGVGFGAGIERLILALEAEGVAIHRGAGDRRVLRVRAGRIARAHRRLARRASLARRLVRHRLRRTLAQGSAHAGRPERGVDGRGRRRRRRHAPACRRARTRRVSHDARSRETVAMSWRDVMCGDPRPEHVGQSLTLAGWVDTRRDHGGLVFVDLRDHTGVTQLVINPERSPTAAELAKEIRNEFVLRARGEVVARSAETMNAAMATGAVELQVDELEIVSRSTPLPFQLDEEGVDENLRLRYRWLDLRTARMQRNMRLSHTVISSIRRTMDGLGFIDVWTPSMTRGTPEGARDFLVPVRLQPGRFFALAQSPQIFKQLCMIGGLDRYYQIATCWRDEDLRADRQFEFRQLDLELAFVERENVLDVLEQVVVDAFAALEREAPSRPFPRLTYADALARYGTDKPDLRFGLEIQDATEVTRGSEFGVFGGAETVRFLVAPRAFSRTELQRLEEIAKEWGAKGLAYLVYDGDEVRSPIAKFLSERELDAFRSEPGSTVLFAAGDEATVARVLGGMRIHSGT